MFCSVCGKEIPENALFCPACGAKNAHHASAEPREGQPREAQPQGTQPQEAQSHAAQSQPVQPQMGQGAPAPAPKKRRAVIAAAAVLGVLLVAVLAVGLWLLLPGVGAGDEVTYTPRSIGAYVDDAGTANFVVDGKLISYPGPVKEALRSPNGDHVVVIDTDGRMLAYSSQQNTGEVVAEDVWLIHTLSDEGVYYMGQDGVLLHYNFETGVHAEASPAGVWNRRYSLGYNQLATVDSDGQLSVFDAEKGERRVVGYVDSSATLVGVADNGESVFWSVMDGDSCVVRRTNADGVTERLGVITAANSYATVLHVIFNDGENAVFYAPGCCDVLVWDAKEGVTAVTLPQPLSYDEAVAKEGVVLDSEDDRANELFFAAGTLDGGYGVYGVNLKGELRQVAAGVGYSRVIRNGRLFYTTAGNALYCKKLDEEGAGDCITLDCTDFSVSHKGEYVYIRSGSALYFWKKGGELQRITENLGDGTVYLTKQDNVIYYLENPTDVAYSYISSGTLCRWQEGSEPQPVLENVLFLVGYGEPGYGDQYYDPQHPVAARFGHYVEYEGFVYDLVACGQDGEQVLLSDILF